ncbi:hypothetical protein HMPREF9621_02127 [Cutibacterium modestum HL037PA2]|nr:hypothetical protein HMPREF9621_02127 [Cutibacterium modestum HL037PA2]
MDEHPRHEPEQGRLPGTIDAQQNCATVRKTTGYAPKHILSFPYTKIELPWLTIHRPWVTSTTIETKPQYVTGIKRIHASELQRYPLPRDDNHPRTAAPSGTRQRIAT